MEGRGGGSLVISGRRPPLIPLATIAGMILALLTVPLPASARTDPVAGRGRRSVAPPASRDVRPVRALSSSGDVTTPGGLLGGGVTPLNRPAPPPKPAWPAGTSVSASSFHGPNNGSDGRPRTYDPANAIDGTPDTFWNDDTFGAYPDVLTIAAPDPVTLPGITLLSNADGVPQDFTVDVWDGAAWQPAATVSGNTDVQRAVPFAQPVATSQVRITVTRDQQTPSGEFTRISEVWPGVVAADPPVPEVVVDFGKVVAGYPRISFTGASANHPGVRLAFSESTQYLSNRSDFTRSDNGESIVPGTDQFAVPATPVPWTDTTWHGKGAISAGANGDRGR